MSHEATNWAFSLRGLKPATKLVLLCLADRHNPDLGCFPSQERLASDAEMSRSGLNNHLATLEEMCLIRREKRINKRTGHQERTRYILGFEAGFKQNDGGPCPDFGHGPQEASDSEPGPECGHGRNGENEANAAACESAPCPEDRHGSVSKKSAGPCPKNRDSRVQSLDTNPVRVTSKRTRNAHEGAREGRVSFSDFWEVYPNQVEQRAAWRAWDAVIAKGADPGEIIEAAQRYTESDVVKRGYAKKPAGWLRDGAWEDYCPQSSGKGAPAVLSEQAAFWAGKIGSGAYVAPSALSTSVIAAMLEQKLVTTEQLRQIGAQV